MSFTDLVCVVGRHELQQAYGVVIWVGIAVAWTQQGCCLQPRDRYHALDRNLCFQEEIDPASEVGSRTKLENVKRPKLIDKRLQSLALAVATVDDRCMPLGNACRILEDAFLRHVVPPARSLDTQLISRIARLALQSFVVAKVLFIRQCNMRRPPGLP